MTGFTASSGVDAVRGMYARLMAFARGLPNDDNLACMLASRAVGQGALPANLGLAARDCTRMVERHFPGTDWPIPADDTWSIDREREPEWVELRELLRTGCAGLDESEVWIADIVAAGCMGSNHLWQDLGLWTRSDLSDLMRANFSELAARNNRDMKWKKFLYKQLCLREGIVACRSPSCGVCPDYDACFGPEE